MTRGRTVTIGSLVAALALIGAAATTLDAPIPKPAWQTDLEQLAGEVKGVKQLATEQALESAELRWVRLRGEAESYHNRGESVPDWLNAEIRKLERRMREYEAEIEALRE